MEMLILFFFLVIALFICVFEAYAMCKVYSKVGIEGWKAIVPIMNVLVLFRFANLSGWMIALLFVPGLNLYLLYLVYAALADRLGKKRSFGFGFVFLPFIFFPLFAFTSKKEEKEEEEEQEEATLLEEPIVPLEARPDLDEIYAQANRENGSIEPIEQEELFSVSNENLSVQSDVMPTLDAAISLEGENPMGMTAKAQYVEEEKKEEILNLDAYKICPNCGTKLDEKATTCFLCGSHFDKEEGEG